MKKQLEPLSILDIEIGKEYVQMSVTIDGHMFYQPFRVLENLPMDIFLVVDTDGSSLDQPRKLCAEYNGLLSDKSHLNMVFYDTPSTREVLKQLADSENLLDYLIAIGYSTKQADKALGEFRRSRSQILSALAIFEVNPFVGIHDTTVRR